VLRAQLAEAIPVPGSGIKLPLDLHAIASRCSNSYYAPRRFAAVQLAFDAPRCRVLIFRAPRAIRTKHTHTYTELATIASIMFEAFLHGTVSWNGVPN
tara:strand:+ start:566 stop:859 length:294 start_codon:yes stop_codon:yes gene_type:complete